MQTEVSLPGHTAVQRRTESGSGGANGEYPRLSQFSLVTQSSPTLCNTMNCGTPHSLSITNSRSPPNLMSTELVMPSNHFIFCRPLLLLPSIFPSIRIFSNESALRIRWPKYWSFSFNISPSTYTYLPTWSGLFMSLSNAQETESG